MAPGKRRKDPGGSRLARPPAVHYVAGELRRIGQELVSGSWSRGARPMPVPNAMAVMASALAFVVDTGLGSVVERVKQTLTDLASDSLAELNFDGDNDDD